MRNRPLTHLLAPCAALFLAAGCSSSPSGASASGSATGSAAPAPAHTTGRPAPPECRIYDELLAASHQRLADYASEEPHRAWARAKADAASNEEMQKMQSALPLTPGFTLPF